MSPGLEIAIRIGCAGLIFAAMAVWEWRAPRRKQTVGRRPRWPGNIGILVIDILAVRLLVPVTAVGIALIATGRGWGLFNLAGLPEAAKVVLGVVALDFVIYGQHFVFHHVPALWRLHRMHHADLDIDVTTGLRFHPLEILISLAIKMAAVVILGVPALAVLIFAVQLRWLPALSSSTDISSLGSMLKSFAMPVLSLACVIVMARVRAMKSMSLTDPRRPIVR